MLMSKKALIATPFLFLLVTFLAYIVFNQAIQRISTPQEKQVFRIANEGSAALSFEPSELTLQNTATPSGSAHIMLDSGGLPLSNVQVELSFNPLLIASLQITPPQGSPKSLFSSSSEYSILLNYIDLKNGRASYGMAVRANAQKTRGSIGILNITLSPFFNRQNTQVNFLAKSNVFTKGAEKSVLKEATPLIIRLASSSAGVKQF